MKSLFPEFYGHDENSYQALWQDATFVLDTNVLLNAYRLPDDARDEFLSLLDDLKERLWIPHQVGLEYQRRRIDVISNRRKKLDELKSGIHSEVGDLVSKIKEIEIEKHSVETNIDEILSGLEGCRGAVTEALSVILEKYSAISHLDEVRDRLDRILEGRVGPPPESQAALDAIFRDGEKRYEHKIPPGYEDIAKSKDEGSHFSHRGLMYKSQYGDFILWRQILDWANSEKLKSIIFVTADNKEDWWHRVSGKTIGPRPELVSEIAEFSNVENFWMYSFSQFGKNAKTYIDAKLSDDSLVEISRVALDARRRQKARPPKHSKELELRLSDRARQSMLTEEIVLGWASKNAWRTQDSHFADRLVFEKDRLKAIEIKHFGSIHGASHFARVMDSLIRADFHLDEEKIDSFQLIFVIDNLRKTPMNDVNDMVDIMRHFRETSYRGGEIEVVLGEIDGDIFRPVLRVTDLSNIDLIA